ncbi:MAG: preprotein translocase subunit SecA [Holosporaceae bacterium]
MLGLVHRFFGSANDRYLKKLAPVVASINRLEPSLKKLTDAQLTAQTDLFKKRLQEGASLDNLLPEAFATVRETAWRVIGQRHYDVQLMGGLILHRGMIAEMKTGEGKTLVSTLPVYLNALHGKGVHVVTVNDYLASRDAAWMGEIYRFLGLTVDCITHDMSDEQRQEAYKADITYATNNELGFDYLRDNMKTRLDERVLRPFSFAIVDEVDSILIDEARTPLIISGPAETSSDLYQKIDALIPSLKDEDFEKDEKARSVMLTESGVAHIEKQVKKAELLKGQHLYDDHNITLVHHIDQALKAHKIFARDVDYIVKNNKVMLVDEFTGRIMDGRRYSDGLHQALEAKEGVEIQIENQTLASVTYQNFFRLYPKLAGMTGTALTEAAEFHEIYNLRVVAVPTNHPLKRQDEDDEVYRTFSEKAQAVLKLIQEVHKKGQPILVGTVSIEKSELFSQLLTKAGIPHQVLNARQHDKEALIIAEAGAPGAITIATNMAGRGTDIELGGNLKKRLEAKLANVTDKAKKEKITQEITEQYQKDREAVLKAGGLFVIGTERHESRRIDNQLRGRSGRQGDPGRSKFFLSLEDDLMRIFGSERLDDWLQKLGLQEGEAITHPWINRALEKAQQKVEARNFDTRKHLLKYDDVMNDQRKVVYGWRDKLIASTDSFENTIKEDIKALSTYLGDQYTPPDTYVEQWDLATLATTLSENYGLSLDVKSWAKEPDLNRQTAINRITDALLKAYLEKQKTYGDLWPSIEKHLFLACVDHNWKEHLYALDHLRQGVHLRSYAQKDPLNEYKYEAFALFQSFFARTTREALGKLLLFSVDPSDMTAAPEHMGQDFDDIEMSESRAFPGTDSVPSGLQDPLDAANPDAILSSKGADAPKISRNAPCPCGSGRRYKNCHGKLA